MKNTLAVAASISALFIAMLSIQSGASFAKGLFPVLGVEGVTAVRLGIAAPIMLILLRAWRSRITRGNWRSLLIYGVTLGSMNLMYYLAVDRLPLGIAAAIEFMGPLAITILYSRRLTDFLWAGLATAGLLLLTPLAGLSSGLDPIGIAWALGAAACWALYIVFGKQAGIDHGPQTAALGMTIGALLVLPFGASEAASALVNPALLPIVLGVALLSSAIPFSLEMVALRSLPTRTFGTLMSAEPAVGALVGRFLLHETLSVQQWIAILLVVAASAGAALSVQGKSRDIAA